MAGFFKFLVVISITTTIIALAVPGISAGTRIFGGIVSGVCIGLWYYELRQMTKKDER